MNAPHRQTPVGGSSPAAETDALHRRCYRIAGVSIAVESPLPILATTFAPKFGPFEVAGPGSDTIVLRHHFDLGREADAEAGVTTAGQERTEVYRRPPWTVFRQGGLWVYEGRATDSGESVRHVHAVFDEAHTAGDIHHPAHVAEWWRAGGLGSLTLMPSDQIVLARVFADRAACLVHAAGVALDGQGLLFVGHSDAGKSTTVELLRRRLERRLEILCDDRIVVRRWPEGFKAHGTWSHGDVPDVSPAGAPLRAVLFLEQAGENSLSRVDDRGQAWRSLLATLVKGLETPDWWRKEMDVLERLIAEVPCFRMRFDRSGAIVDELEGLVRSSAAEGGRAR